MKKNLILFLLYLISFAAFADIMERNCASKAGAAALGVVPSSGDDLLENAGIPAVRVSVGFVTGEKDSINLAEKSYLSKVSDGVYDAVLEAFEVME